MRSSATCCSALGTPGVRSTFDPASARLPRPVTEHARARVQIAERADGGEAARGGKRHRVQHRTAEPNLVEHPIGKFVALLAGFEGNRDDGGASYGLPPQRPRGLIDAFCHVLGLGIPPQTKLSIAAANASRSVEALTTVVFRKPTVTSVMSA